MGKVDKAVQWALKTAQSPAHGYDQIHRWGPDYDCSSFLIQAWENAGVPVKKNGATYTGNMKSVFLKSGFSDITKNVDMGSGAGLIKGDIVLNEINHTAMVYDNSRRLVMASVNEKGTVTGGVSGDQTGGEIKTRSYYNYPWDCVLRYTAENPAQPEKEKLSVDAVWGPSTNRQTQRFVGAGIIDGIISGQPNTLINYLQTAESGYWIFTPIESAEGSRCIELLQNWLKRNSVYSGKSDGYFGPDTIKALQTFLAGENLYTGNIDGILGIGTTTAWQTYLNSH